MLFVDDGCVLVLMFVVCGCMLPDVCRSLCVVCCLLYVLGCLLCVDRGVLFDLVWCSLFDVCRCLFVVACLLFVCLLSVVV